jgi:hypothetical protein
VGGERSEPRLLQTISLSDPAAPPVTLLGGAIMGPPAWANR